MGEFQANHTDVAVAIVADRPAGAEPRVLIARRPADKAWGGYWELPGGKREPGETVEQCLHRELREELGVAVALERALPAIDHAYETAAVRLHPFLCALLDGAEPQPLEGGELRWSPAQALQAPDFPPANGPLLDQLRRELSVSSESAE